LGFLTKKRGASFGDGLIGMCNLGKTIEKSLRIDYQYPVQPGNTKEMK